MKTGRYGLASILLFQGILFFSSICYGQQPSTVLIVSNKAGKVLIDGEEKGECVANVPFKVTTTSGEHYAQVQVVVNGAIEDKGEIISLEEGKQRVLKIVFDASQVSATTPLNEEVPEIKISDLNFAIPGQTTVGLWMSENPDQEYPYPTHFIAFEKGDEMILNTSMTNKKGTNQIEIRTYPGNVLKYSNRSFSELNDLRIKVDERSIYRITLSTNHIFDRNCLMTVARKPASVETAAFNTNVTTRKIYTAISVVEPTSQFVNGETNATVFGGKSRLLVPVTLPPNTIEWFYRFSASRNEEDIENVKAGFGLASELTGLLASATGLGATATKVLSIAVEQLSMPPGSDYCDVFMLTYDEVANFQEKVGGQWKYVIEGTRQNLMSGNVKVSCCNEGQYYLGLRNPSWTYGINVSMEVTAITEKEEYVMESR